MSERIAIIGLGYVGLPLAVALAEKFDGVVGFDINEEKVQELKSGVDRSGEVDNARLAKSPLRMTTNPRDLAESTFFIVAVPTPVDRTRRPDLGPVLGATEMIGSVLRKGAVVVYESTVYPGVTEELCGPILEERSGLRRGADFKLGYSPERVNPGDREHTLERIVKVVSGEDGETLERVAAVYEKIIEAGIHRAPGIKVAEAAKVIENIQRDLNIALMNELALIFNLMDIDTGDVLEAAGTKWNFLRFKPGLVGGHCIGVDPYYLTYKAEELDYHPQVILSGRRINDSMGKYVAQQTVKLLALQKVDFARAKVGILGLTFKENVPDLRNSKVADIVAELKEHGIDALVHDPLAGTEEARHEYGLSLAAWEDMRDLDAMVLAVCHRFYVEQSAESLLARLKPRGVLIDVKWVLDRGRIPAGISYWRL